MQAQVINKTSLFHFFHICTVHPAIVKVFFFNYQLMHKRTVLKRSIKIYIKIAPTCFGVITIIRERTV